MLFIFELTNTVGSEFQLKVNNIAKCAKSANNGAQEMEFSSPYCEVDAEYNGVGFVKISKIFATHDTFLLWNWAI